MINGDSQEYDLLQEACDMKQVDPHQDSIITVEIGVREGLGSKIILDTYKDVAKPHYHFGIDPYGNLNYAHYDNNLAYTADYTNQMRDTLLKDLSYYPNFKFFNLTDKEFMKRYHDGVPVYDNSKETIYNVYDLVHFDGPHKTKEVLEEAIFFANRSSSTAVFVFDDHKTYDMNLIGRVLNYYNFKEIKKGAHKTIYEKKI